MKSGNADVPGFHARCIAGGIFVSGRWVDFAFTVNWFAAEAQDPETETAFFSAIHQALTSLMGSLSGAT